MKVIINSISEIEFNSHFINASEFAMALFLAGISMLAAVQACTVTPVEVPGGCASLPSYDSSTGIAGPWVVEVNQCVNTTATDNACSIEGFGSEAVYFLQQGDTSVQRGYVLSPFYISKTSSL